MCVCVCVWVGVSRGGGGGVGVVAGCRKGEEDEGRPTTCNVKQQQMKG